MPTGYDGWLAALSYIVAVLASYTAIDLAGRVTEFREERRKAMAWLAGGALAMGAGVWAMHFVGMLAYRLPIPVQYELRTTLASMAVAIATSGFALFIITRHRFSVSRRLIGGAVMGTVDYMAPEQALSTKSADARADIYSLGCTLYYLLTANVPFPAGTAVEKVIAHVTADPIPIQQMRSDIPTALTAILGQMMARDPDDRFQTAVEVARALMPFSRPENGETPPALDTQIDVALQHVKHGTDTTSQTLLQSDEDLFIKGKNAIQPVTQQDVAQQIPLQPPVRKSMNAKRLGALLVVGYLGALMWAIRLHRENQLPLPWGS